MSRDCEERRRVLLKQYRRWLNYRVGNRKNIFGLRLTVTWRCDCKCTTCSIWNIKDAGKNDLQVSEFDALTRSKQFHSTEYVTLSGGEPTLRSDLGELISVLHRNVPSAVINMTTNGMNPQRTEKLFRDILKRDPDIRFGLVGLSLNGPREVHDRTRGVEGSYERVLETHDRIKDLVPCGFSFTFCRDNVEHFEWVQEFAKSRGSFAYICWTVMNERFNVSEKDLVFWKPELEEKLHAFALRSPHFIGGSMAKLKNLLFLPAGITKSFFYDQVINMKIMPCYAGGQIVHVDPEGNVYPCNFKLTPDRILGNLREKNFDEIWNVNPRKILAEIKRGECMYPNGLCGDSDIYPSICNHPPVVMRWYIRKLLRRERLVKKKK